ncbi:MAG: Mut7-C RNAse domain-containing protein [Nitrospinae bacterium]|nr:Mut7-C RNAse domain-containing protein [Nitrospinota bacterium]
MKFIVDLTMGKLVKWLRIAGYDTVFYNSANPDKLIEIASKEGRILLTRNSNFIKNKKKILKENGIKYLLLTDDRVENQLKEVAADFKLNLRDNFFTLCINCNKPLTNMPKEDVAGKVPEFVYQNYNEFVQCTNCKKIFWGGTHRERMEKIIKTIIPLSYLS